jgi:hypothetical protein
VSLDGLARFAASSSGRAYAAACERFGVDPARELGGDDVVAVSFRVALHHSLNVAQMEAHEQAERAQSDKPGVVTDLEDVIRKMRVEG